MLNCFVSFTVISDIVCILVVYNARNFDLYLVNIFSLTVEFKSKCRTCLNITDGPFGNNTFSFNQLHFHWGSDNEHGSEHQISGKK